MELNIGDNKAKLYISDRLYSGGQATIEVTDIHESYAYGRINKDNAIEIINHLKKVFELDKE